jgi:uncharacterized surface protein with fasciclin (FAS1) repeats
VLAELHQAQLLFEPQRADLRADFVVLGPVASVSESMADAAVFYWVKPILVYFLQKKMARYCHENITSNQISCRYMQTIRSHLGCATHPTRGDVDMKFQIASIVAAAVAAIGITLGSADTRAAQKDIVETAVDAGKFKTLAAALGAAELVDTLKGRGPFTVFAPTDEAFAKLPAGTVENLLKPENKDQLVAMLTYHVVPGKVMAADVVKLKEAKTVNGQMLDIKTKGNAVMVNDAKVTKTDIGASNGVIHVIDTVILPPKS